MHYTVCTNHCGPPTDVFLPVSLRQTPSLAPGTWMQSGDKFKWTPHHIIHSSFLLQLTFSVHVAFDCACLMPLRKCSHLYWYRNYSMWNATSSSIWTVRQYTINNPTTCPHQSRHTCQLSIIFWQLPNSCYHQSPSSINPNPYYTTTAIIKAYHQSWPVINYQP